MSSIRATIAEARACLERVNAPDANPTVKRILGKKAECLVKEAEDMLSRTARSVGMKSMPASFADAIITQREHGPSPTPVVVMRCPEMTREEFIEWRKTQTPSHFADTTVGKLQ